MKWGFPFNFYTSMYCLYFVQLESFMIRKEEKGEAGSLWPCGQGIGALHRVRAPTAPGVSLGGDLSWVSAGKSMGLRQRLQGPPSPRES